MVFSCRFFLLGVSRGSPVPPVKFKCNYWWEVTLLFEDYLEAGSVPQAVLLVDLILADCLLRPVTPGPSSCWCLTCPDCQSWGPSFPPRRWYLELSKSEAFISQYIPTVKAIEMKLQPSAQDNQVKGLKERLLKNLLKRLGTIESCEIYTYVCWIPGSKNGVLETKRS